MPSKTTIGENIYRLRKKLRWSQATLADKIGVSRAAISQFELGDINPSRANEKKLSDALGENICDPKSLAHAEEPPAGGRHHPDLWANVIAARNNKGWSQQQLAERLGITQSQVELLEGGAAPIQPVYSQLVILFGEEVLTQVRKKASAPYLVVVARSEQEYNERVHELLCSGYVLRGRLHVVTDAEGLLLVHDLERS